MSLSQALNQFAQNLGRYRVQLASNAELKNTLAFSLFPRFDSTAINLAVIE